MTTNTPVTPQDSSAACRPQAPPEEEFWKRYSPHHEASLSGITSLAIHILIIPTMLLFAWLALRLGLREENAPLPVETVRLTFDNRDGDGRPNGPGPGPGDTQAAGTPRESGEQPGNDRLPPPDPPPPLTPAKKRLAQVVFADDLHAQKLIEQGSPMGRALLDMSEDLRQSLRKTVNPNVGRPSPSPDGPSRDGGKGPSTDKGEGSGPGEGGSPLNQRERRQLRWTMSFNTQDGRDYLRQLHGLRAIVAIPQTPTGPFLVIRDLSNPRAARVEDISTLNRIYWVDNREQSVQQLASALGIPPPPFIVAFFPQELEQWLLELEMAQLREKHNLDDENLIQETRFDVLRGTGGQYEVSIREVILQEPAPADE